MPRNISFMLTTEQVKARTKTVTRRLKWLNLKPGEILNGCKKCMGLKPGEKIERIARIRVVSVRREILAAITDEDVVKEGFPGKDRKWFIEMFIREMKPKARELAMVTRIEFEYL